MSEETVVSGNNDEPIVYLVGTDPQFNGPSGIPMIETENNQWETTINLLPGTYTYKFRNGFYDYWDSPGWESISGDCTVGEWDDRLSLIHI